MILSYYCSRCTISRLRISNIHISKNIYSFCGYFLLQFCNHFCKYKIISCIKISFHFLQYRFIVVPLSIERRFSKIQASFCWLWFQSFGDYLLVPFLRCFFFFCSSFIFILAIMRIQWENHRIFGLSIWVQSST